ncbi:YncE family protein [Nocardioides pacificus]
MPPSRPLPPRLSRPLAALFALVVGLALLAAPPAAAYDPEHTIFRGSATSMGQTNGPVWALEMAGGRIYAGGGFTSTRPTGAAEGTSETGQAHLAAFDAATGAPLSSFAPQLTNDYTNGPATVHAMALSPDGKTLYVGGDFNRINGQKAEHVAKFDAATGAFLGQVGWNGVDGTVRALAVSPDGNTLYVGGNFARANWTTRRDAAAFDLRDNSVTAWEPKISDNVVNEALRVTALAVAGGGNRVFMTGTFRKVNGVAAQGFIAVSSTTGANVPNWRADYLLASTNWGTTLEVVGSTVYLGARDDQAGSLDRKEGVYSLEASTGAVNWYARCYGDTFGLQAVGNDLYVASHAHDCAGAGGMPETAPRTYLAIHAINRTTGIMKPYFVQTSGTGGSPNTMLLSRALATDGTHLVMGGGFSRVNGTAQANLARFATGSAAPERAAWPSAKSCSGCRYVDVSVLEGADRDDVDLRYEVFRGWGLTDPIAVVDSESAPYATETFTVRDTGVSAGQEVFYRVRVSDPAGNQVVSVRSASVVVGR